MYFDMLNGARKGDLSDFDMLLNEFDMLGEACQESKIWKTLVGIQLIKNISTFPSAVYTKRADTTSAGW